jgi:hypothetical protein
MCFWTFFRMWYSTKLALGWGSLHGTMRFRLQETPFLYVQVWISDLFKRQMCTYCTYTIHEYTWYVFAYVFIQWCTYVISIHIHIIFGYIYLDRSPGNITLSLAATIGRQQPGDISPKQLFTNAATGQWSGRSTEKWDRTSEDTNHKTRVIQQNQPERRLWRNEDFVQ